MDYYDYNTLQPHFNFLNKCAKVTQGEHHPEGAVLDHSLQVLYWAFKETNDIDLIFAAMLHDIGKIESNKGHENIALEWLEPHCSIKTLWLIEHHMRIWNLLNGEMKKLDKVQYLINHPWLPELIQLARFDKLGRNPNKKYIWNLELIEDIISKLNKKVELHFIGNRQ